MEDTKPDLHEVEGSSMGCCNSNLEGGDTGMDIATLSLMYQNIGNQEAAQLFQPSGTVYLVL